VGVEMAWWQYLIISLASVALGAFIGYFLNKRGVQNERDASEWKQLRSAVKGLLTEMSANLKLIEKGPDMALLPPLAKDMWNIHKSRIVELPSEMQACLYEAYIHIDYVNAVLDSRADFGIRPNGLGVWDTRYKNEAEKARKPMEKARDCLKVWLKEQQLESCGEAEQTQSNIEELQGEALTKDNKTHDNLMRKLIVSQVPVYFFASFLFIQGAGLSQKGESSRYYWVYIGLGFILLVWAFILCVDAWRGQRIFRKFDKAMEIPYWVISTAVFGVALITNLVALVQTSIGNLYFYIYYSAGIALLILLLIHFVQSARR
jgi:hypothetical protein